MPAINRGTTMQKCVGNAYLFLPREADTGARFGDYLVWTGLDKRLNFLNRAPSVSPDTFVQSPIGTDIKSSYGPAWVVLPDQMSGYCIYVSQADGGLILRKFTRKPSPGPDALAYEWTVGAPQAFPKASPGSAVSAHLGTQNGRLCLNLAWAAAGTGMICLGQAFVDPLADTLAFSSMLTLDRRACTDGVCLIRDGRRYMLAYFDKADNKMRLAHSGDHVFEFDPARDCVLDIRSIYAPAIVRLNTGLIYVAYTEYTTKVLTYAIAGSGADGKYKIAVTGIVSQSGGSATAGPTIWPYRVLKDGVGAEQLLVTYPDETAQVIFVRMSIEPAVIPM